MRHLPLYPEPPSLAVEKADPLLRHDGLRCTRCSLGAGAISNCLGAELVPGSGATLLVIAGSPTQVDDKRGRPFVSASGDWVRQLLKRHWAGEVVFDHALRCTAGREPPDEAYAACRGYLTAIIRDTKPSKIICLGAKAAKGLIGDCPPLDSVHRAYTYLDATSTPVYLFPDASYAMRNKFIRAQFERDLEWALGEAHPVEAPRGKHYRLVETFDDAVAAKIHLMSQPWLAFDCEASGQLYTPEFKLLTVAVSGPDEQCYVWEEEVLRDPASFAVLREILEQGPGKTGQNIKYDLQAAGCHVSPVVGDTRIKRRLISSEAMSALAVQQWMVGMGGGKDEAEEAGGKAATEFKRRVNAALKSTKLPDTCGDRAKVAVVRHTLPSTCIRDHEGPGPCNGWARPDCPGYQNMIQVFHLQGPEEARVTRAMRRAEERNEDRKAWYMSLMDPELRARYCALDTVSTARLESLQAKQLEELPAIKATWENLVCPSIMAYTRMERVGVPVNVEKARTLGREIRLRQEPVLERMRSYPSFASKTDDELRTALNSPQQRCAFLYDTLKLKPPGGRRSADKEALEELDHPAVADLRLWNELDKLRSTYADGLPPYVSDGRVHPSFNVDGTRSGRTSCQDPNLQNIPRARGDLAKACKGVFEAPDGWKLIQLDYSQLELRIACQLSGDPVMEEIFASGEDYHQRTGRILFEEGVIPEQLKAGWVPGLPWDQLPDEAKKIFRDMGKTFNFALIFQQGDRALAANMGSTKEAAARVRKAILGRLATLRRWMTATIDEARRTGEVWTFWDQKKARRRLVWDFGETAYAKVGHAERVAGNGPIQGSANEFKIASLVAIDRWLQEDKLPARCILEVHDSIVIEARDEGVSEVAEGARAIMTSWPSAGTGKAALKVDVEVGQDWGHLEKLAG